MSKKVTLQFLRAGDVFRLLILSEQESNTPKDIQFTLI